MRRLLSLAALGALIATPSRAEQSLFLAYPPNNHETQAEQIFFIGTAPPSGKLTINDAVIQRNAAGHFAPSFPLQLGNNRFTLDYGDQSLTVVVTRTSKIPIVPQGLAFAPDSLTPVEDIARLPNEPICFSAIAPPAATVRLQLGQQTLSLSPQVSLVELPPNSAVLTGMNQPHTTDTVMQYAGCTTVATLGDLGQPQYQLSRHGRTIDQLAPGRVEILTPARLPAIEVTAEAGVARTGPGTDYSRLTPLPQGTQASVTGRTGEWLRLDYGGWIRGAETRLLASGVPPKSHIRSIRARQVSGWTEVIFPLQMPVPITIHQGSVGDASGNLRTLTLTLHNTIAQTDTIHLNDDPLVARLDWHQVAPEQVRYIFNLKTETQWGYKVRYEGTSLILALRHPPAVPARNKLHQPIRQSAAPGTLVYGNQASGAGLPGLAGIKILIDPGHGSENDLGAVGPTGYPEKDATLAVSKLLQQELIQRGATVIMTREGDEDLYPQDRVDIINATEPTLALSLHYNALPDDGDALNTQGIGTFWYHPQAHRLAVDLHNYLVETLDRPSYGIFWNNLALTRPTVAPAVLLELGFMIHPDEFEWIIDPQAQAELAVALAEGIEQWFKDYR